MNNNNEKYVSQKETNFIKCHRHKVLCNNMEMFCKDNKYSSQCNNMDYLFKGHCPWINKICNNKCINPNGNGNGNGNGNE